MTWDEFKATVDKELKDQDVDGSVDIEYIDVNWEVDAKNIDVHVDAEGLSIGN